MKETKHLAIFRRTHLRPGEEIYCSIPGYVADRTQFEGELILTDQRVCFYRKGMLGEVAESVPLGSITSVETRTTLMNRKVTLHTSHDDLKFGTLGNKQLFETFMARLEQVRGKGAAATPLAAASPLDELKKLGDLKDAGLLTQAEFDCKKAELLARI